MARLAQNPQPLLPRVALLVETSKVFGRGVLRGIARYVREHGPWSIYMDERGLTDPLPQWLRSWNGQGIILRTSDKRTRDAARKSSAKLVFLGEPQAAGLPMVRTDESEISQLAADHLLQRGLEHFGYVGIAGHGWSEERRDAFRARLGEAGRTCEVIQFALGEPAHARWAKEQATLVRWLERLSKPVGVMACYDVMGLRMLDACRSVGLAVPEQVAVIGVDDDEVLCGLTDPPLTSVAHDLERIGYEAAALLDRLMAGQQPPSATVTVAPRGVVIRQSSDVVAVSDPEMAQAMRVIREQACNGIDVQDVARYVGMSRTTLARRFRSILKRSVHEEIAAAQLKQVQRLLAETELPLKQVAKRAGFRHVTYMSTAFKKVLGMTPGQYRERNLKRS